MGRLDCLKREKRVSRTGNFGLSGISVQEYNRGALARLPASEVYLFASGEHSVAGGDGIEVTRGDASYWAQPNKI